MNNTSAANTSLKNSSGSSVIVYSKVEGVAWCSAFILASIFVVVGNMLAIFLFAANKTLRKKSLYLVINMAFADLMLGVLSMPAYIFFIGGTNFYLWTGRMSKSLDDASDLVDAFFMHASLISAAMISGERCIAVYSRYKRTLSMRTYRIVISTSWVLTALVIAFEKGSGYLTSSKYEDYVWISFGLTITFIICGCNIGIWRKFQQAGDGIAFNHPNRQNRASRSKRLTKTLLFVSVLALLSWFPLIIMDALEYMFGVTISANRYYYTVTLINYSNSFVNPVVYVFRIPEFRDALASCCFKRQAAINMKNTERGRNRSLTQLKTLRVDPGHQVLLRQKFIWETIV